MSDTAVQHTPQPVKSLKIAQEAQSRLLVVGIVGAVGAGTSWTARVLQRLLELRSPELGARTWPSDYDCRTIVIKQSPIGQK